MSDVVWAESALTIFSDNSVCATFWVRGIFCLVCQILFSIFLLMDFYIFRNIWIPHSINLRSTLAFILFCGKINRVVSSYLGIWFYSVAHKLFAEEVSGAFLFYSFIDCCYSKASTFSVNSTASSSCSSSIFLMTENGALKYSFRLLTLLILYLNSLVWSSVSIL